MSLLGELTFALIAPNTRSIAGFLIPDVVVEEAHHDELVITEFPVEEGAAITDHAYKRPAALVMRVGFSNSSAGSEGYVQAVYESMLRLQNSRRPFSVTTGKRLYRDMLVSAIDVTTDGHSENVLMAMISLRQIILTTTSVRADSSAKSANDPANQAMPSATQSPTETGPRQLQLTSEFIKGPSQLGLLPSTADATLGDLQFEDGSTYPGGPATAPALAGVSPGSLPGNLGLFGNYGPNAFRPNASAPGAFGRGLAPPVAPAFPYAPPYNPFS